MPGKTEKHQLDAEGDPHGDTEQMLDDIKRANPAVQMRVIGPDSELSDIHDSIAPPAIPAVEEVTPPPAMTWREWLTNLFPTWMRSTRIRR